MTGMKVLLVAHIGHLWGGPAQRYSDLVSSSLAHKVQLTFFDSSESKKTFSEGGAFTTENIFNFLVICYRYILTVIRVRPSIVHIASSFGFSFVKNSILIVIAKLWGCKVILAPHCSISIFIPGSRIWFHWMQFVLHRCDGMIVLSNEWLKIQEISPKTKIVLLQNSINLTNYLKLKRPNNNHDEIRIIYLGHIGADKGTMDLIQAVKILKDNEKYKFIVRIFGADLHPGELVAACDLASSLKLEEFITFSSPIFGDNKMEVFQEADIYILPSHHEGLPISIIEAMAAGLPVIATKVGGIPELIDNLSNGILVNSNNPSDLADAMKILIDEKELRTIYGLRGRKRALEKHDVEKYVDRLIKFYEDIRHS